MGRKKELKNISLYLFIRVYLRLSAVNNSENISLITKSVIGDGAFYNSFPYSVWEREKRENTEYGNEKKEGIYFSLALNKSPGGKAPFSVIIAVIKSAGVTSKAGL